MEGRQARREGISLAGWGCLKRRLEPNQIAGLKGFRAATCEE